MAEDRLLTTEEAAARLGLGKHTLEVWRMRREGPEFRKLGGKCVRYRLSDLEAFVDAAGGLGSEGGAC